MILRQGSLTIQERNKLQMCKAQREVVMINIETLVNVYVVFAVACFSILLIMGIVIYILITHTWDRANSRGHYREFRYWFFFKYCGSGLGNNWLGNFHYNIVLWHQTACLFLRILRLGGVAEIYGPTGVRVDEKGKKKRIIEFGNFYAHSGKELWITFWKHWPPPNRSDFGEKYWTVIVKPKNECKEA